MEVKVKVINISNNPLPEYETPGSACMDVRANLKDSVILKPGENVCIPIGLKVEIPEGWEIQVRPRSGLALKRNITVENTPGCVDSDYRDEIGVILINNGKEDFQINNGDRIAQIKISKADKIVWEPVITLSGPNRGGGFGHTGI